MTFKDSQRERKIRDSILQKRLPLRAVAHAGNISSIDFFEWWTQRAHLPQTTNHDEIFKLLEIVTAYSQNPEKCKNNQSSLPLITTTHSPPTALPAKYSNTPLSYVSTSRHILEVIELQFGHTTYQNVLFSLGVTKEYFLNIENKINLKFFEDLLHEYSKLCLGKPNYNLLSRSLFLTVEGSALSQKFCSAKSYREAYEQIEASIPHFDQNFEYKFQIGHLGAEIIAKPSEQLAESVKNMHYGSDELYKYRAMLFGNMVTLCDLSPLQIEVARCISSGDKLSRYIARYS